MESDHSGKVTGRITLASSSLVFSVMASKQWKKDNIQKLRKYRREWYNRNKIEQRKLSAERRKVYKKEIKLWYVKYKATLSCSRCIESDYRCLDFHHKDRTTKTAAVSQMVNEGKSLKSIKKEIEKCIILCANCHRKETLGPKLIR